MKWVRRIYENREATNANQHEEGQREVFLKQRKFVPTKFSCFHCTVITRINFAHDFQMPCDRENAIVLLNPHHYPGRALPQPTRLWLAASPLLSLSMSLSIGLTLLQSL